MELEESIKKCRDDLPQHGHAMGHTKHHDIEVIEDDDFLHQDILDALSLIAKAKTLFDYLSDTDLCKGISKKERGSMIRLSEKMKAFIDEVEDNYHE